MFDLGGWGVMVGISCVALVAVAGLWRLTRLLSDGSKESAVQQVAP
jgi:hypothetical protein